MRHATCVLLLAIGLCAAACKTPQWHREGSSKADLEADKQACTEESGNTSGVSNLYTSRYVSKCLMERGWIAGPAPRAAEQAARTAETTAPPPPPGADEPALPAPSLDFDTCFERCRSLTDRTKEECFDTCLAAESD